ncbi:hypothetical protein B0T26DRAFT_751193 [Lasiosphaeria miniovina]|uniref:Mid2 domain-containing protein n=1 Tax=Lasiosphaeria miniovina TaxID=1954250 RepID=A0AA40AJQ4_9PEZI|nr:uncharacterized protein B0T26DRAFT_751193 [Lasiosphaeria miniovina]KAK0717088.1 hypothetical protein B0T26DRAFT_751193 [Lasiosphaeria miniovina]
MHIRNVFELLVLGLSAASVVEATLLGHWVIIRDDAHFHTKHKHDSHQVIIDNCPDVNPTNFDVQNHSSTTPPPSTSPPPSTDKSSSSSEVVETTTETYTTTNSDGSKSTVTTKSLTTSTAGLVSNDSGQSSGMSTQTRNTVIGVVVGVGGAIILGGLAFVAFRIWGRKKTPDADDGLMDYNSTADKTTETSGSMTGRTPFQSTLESYHAPTQVNTASNF